MHLPDEPFNLILGLGQTGLSVARFLAAKGVGFAVADSREQPPLLDMLLREFPDVPVATGSVPEDWVRRATNIVVSPGIPPDSPLLSVVQSEQLPIDNDIGLFLEMAAAPVIGITGSNAKSTVTTLVGEMARRAGMKVAVGGNLGTPVLELLDPEVELYVLELSSFQLAYTRTPNLSVGAMLNLSPDHLDWHGSDAAYAAAKQRVFEASKWCVYNRGDTATIPQQRSDYGLTFGLDEPSELGVGLVHEGDDYWISTPDEALVTVAEIAMQGEHNLENALAAVAIASAAGIPTQAVAKALREFSGLRHRCELVGEYAGLKWINDSKATNVGACLAALRGLGGAHKLVLIAGGQAKGADLMPLADPVQTLCRGVVVMGEAASDLLALTGNVPAIQALNMEAAVASARRLGEPGDTVLLSPACASFDMFSGFEDRGDQFRDAVMALGAKP